MHLGRGDPSQLRLGTFLRFHQRRNSEFEKYPLPSFLSLQMPRSHCLLRLLFLEGISRMHPLGFY